MAALDLGGSEQKALCKGGMTGRFVVGFPPSVADRTHKMKSSPFGAVSMDQHV